MAASHSAGTMSRQDCLSYFMSFILSGAQSASIEPGWSLVGQLVLSETLDALLTVTLSQVTCSVQDMARLDPIPVPNDLVMQSKIMLCLKKI